MRPLKAPKRRPKISEHELQQLLKQKGLSACLVAMESEMAKRGLAIHARYINNINYGTRTVVDGKRFALIGIWPYRSTAAEGLLVSVGREWIPDYFDVSMVAAEDVPGIPGPVVGYMNCYRFLRSPDEVVQLWDTLVPMKAASL